MNGLNSPDFAVALLAAGVGALKITAVWALVVTALASWRPTAGIARALTPAAVRFVVAAGLSGAMATGGAAHADELDGLRLPDRPATLPSEHIVQPGDSLWSIAIDHMDHDPGDAAVLSATKRWYEANREVIGPDPDLIQPGQRLLDPEARP